MYIYLHTIIITHYDYCKAWYLNIQRNGWDKLWQIHKQCIMMHHDASWCIQKSVKDPKTWGRTRAFASNVSLSKCCCLSSARAAGRQDAYLCACCKVPCDSCRSSYQFSPSSLSWLLSGFNGFQTCLRIGKTYPSESGLEIFEVFLGAGSVFLRAFALHTSWLKLEPILYANF